VTDHANSFGPVADVYERGRPPYPAEALDWLLPAGTPRVVDLGAGTGKLTRLIRDRGLDVTAVDPSDGMLEVFRRSVPGVPALRGSAERIPLPGHAADVVLVAQAWHWVDVGRAVPEAARVLAPGGRLGLIWNLRDHREDWVRQLGEIINSPELIREDHLGVPVEKHDFPWTHEIGLDRLLDLVASRSYVILLGAQERAELLARVRTLTETHPALAGRTTFAMPYVTHCVRAELTPSS
jgi:SAM-dependent methyltransferase